MEREAWHNFLRLLHKGKPRNITRKEELKCALVAFEGSPVEMSSRSPNPPNRLREACSRACQA